MKLSNPVAALAAQIETAWMNDLKVQYSGASALPLEARLKNRVDDLMGAIRARSGVKEHAARVGALLVQLDHIGDTPLDKEPELPFKEAAERAEDEDDDEEPAEKPKRGSPKRES